MVEPEEVTLRVSLDYTGPWTPRTLAGTFEVLSRIAVGAVALEWTTWDKSPDEFRFLSHQQDALNLADIRVTRMGLESPLWLELLFGTSGAGGASLFFRWLVTHSEEVGGAIPKAVRAWKSEWAAVHDLSNQALYLPGDVTVAEIEPGAMVGDQSR